MKFVMLIGPSGCGKSTLAAELEAQSPGLVVLSSDQIISDLCAENGVSYVEGFHRFKDLAKKCVKQRMSRAIEQGSDILLDQTNLKRKVRVARLSMLPDEYEKICVAFEADYSTLMHRLHERRNSGGQEVPGYILREQLSRYEMPDYDEGFDRIILQKVPSRQVDRADMGQDEPQPEM